MMLEKQPRLSQRAMSSSRASTLALRVLGVLCVLCGSGFSLLAYDGEDMAPGLARLGALEPEGVISIRVMDTLFVGRWRRAETAGDSTLLREHWRGGRTALEREQPRLAVAELRGSNGTRLRCEFVNDLRRLAGVCAQDGLRLYYLAPPSDTK
jgi:hypothetical protein